jgi:tetratricopeptide (TPR) repeat protein
MFEVDGERVDAPAGTLLFPRPGVTRTAFAEEPETSILALGARPGKAYEPSDWEVLNPLYEAGKYAEAADRARELLEAHPESAVLLYNLACYESMAGRTADAIEHLRPALDRSEDLRELAKSDSDLDPIRGEPAFNELVG